MDKKKAAAAAVASVIAASGTAVEASIDDPADLMQQTGTDPKVEYVGTDADQSDDDTKKESIKEKRTAREAFGDWLLGLPLGVRILFVLPQWIIGTLIVGAGQVLFTALSPFASWILSFLLITLVIGAAFLVTAKAMFPDLPIGKILNRHSIKWILVASVIAFGVDLALGFLWTGYTRYKMIFIAGIILLSLISLVIWFDRRERRRRRAEAEKQAQLEEKEPEELVYSSLGQTFTIKNR